jgi:hypothetical protein
MRVPRRPSPYSDERIIPWSYADGTTCGHRAGQEKLSNVSSDVGADVGHSTDTNSNTLLLRRSQRCHHGGQQNTGFTVSRLHMPDTGTLHRHVRLPLPC